jgi:hypothetical protein
MPGAEAAIEDLVSASVSDLVSAEPFNKVISFAAATYKIPPLLCTPTKGFPFPESAL